MQHAGDMAMQLAGLAIVPYFAGAFFAGIGRAVWEAAMAPGSSRFRQIAHFWIAGLFVVLLASGKLQGAVSSTDW